jgi:hypothetical protein
MTARQQEIAQLLRDLGKTPELIAIQTELPVDRIKDWLKTGVWKVRQRTLFDAGEVEPRETQKPAITVAGNRGLQLFSRDLAGRP